MNGAIIGVFLVIIAYLVMMLAIGFFYSKGNNDSSDFYLGGRKLGPFVTAMSAEASDMSSWLLMGLPGVAYLSGICDASWTAIGLAIGTYLNWLIVAKRIRRYSAKTNSITLPDFFANRYCDDSKLLLGISAIFIIIFFVPYTASGFAACGKLFSTLFGIPYTAAMLISAVVIVGYTALGGFMAASFTDLIQSIVMTIALVLVVCFGVSMSGGVQNVLENAKELPGFLSLTATYNSLAASSAVSENLLKGMFGVNLTEKRTIHVARATVLFIAVIAVFLAGNPDSSVFGIVSFAWAGFGAVFGPVVLAALFWKRSNRNGALVGMIAGGVMVFVWKYCVRPLGGAWNVYELLPAFIIAMLCLIVVSLATGEPSKEIQEEFEEVRAGK